MKVLLSPHDSTKPYKEEWLCDSEEEVETLPESTPPGSKVIYNDDGEPKTKIKMPNGEWISGSGYATQTWVQSYVDASIGGIENGAY